MNDLGTVVETSWSGAIVEWDDRQFFKQQSTGSGTIGKKLVHQQSRLKGNRSRTEIGWLAHRSVEHLNCSLPVVFRSLRSGQVGEIYDCIPHRGERLAILKLQGEWQWRR
jgi:hypothetical protein